MRVIGIVGWKDNGKTTLVERLVSHFDALGLKVSTVKHAHHDVDVDKPGKDSWRHRQAGACEVVIATSRRFVVIHELKEEPEPPLDELLARMSEVDLVLVEGFKSFPHPKIEVHRQARGTPLLAESDDTVVAVAADCALPGLAVPVFDLDDIKGLGAFILSQARRQAA